MNESLSKIRERREMISAGNMIENQTQDETNHTPENKHTHSCPYPECHYKTKRRVAYSKTPEDRMKCHVKKHHSSDNISHESPRIKRRITGKSIEKEIDKITPPCSSSNAIMSGKRSYKRRSNVKEGEFKDKRPYSNRYLKSIALTKRSKKFLITNSAKSKRILRRNTISMSDPCINLGMQQVQNIPSANVSRSSSTGSKRVRKFLIAKTDKTVIDRNSSDKNDPGNDIQSIFNEIQEKTISCKHKIEKVFSFGILENQKLQENISRLQKEVESKTVDLNLSKNKEIAKDVALNEYQKQINSLKKSLEAKQSGVEELLKEQARLKGELNQSVSNCSLLQAELKQIKDSGLGTQKEMNEANKEIQTIKEMYLKKSKECLELELEKEKLLPMIKKYENELQASINIQEDLRNELETSKIENGKEVMKIQEEIDLLKQNLKHDSADDPALQKSFLNRSPEYQRLLKDKEDLQIKAKELKDESDKAIKEKEGISMRFFQYESKFNRMQLRLKENGKEIQDMKFKVSISELENQELKGNEKYYKQTLAAKDKIITNLENEKDTINGQVRNLRQQLDVSNKKQEDLARKLGLKHYHAKENCMEIKTEVDVDQRQNNINGTVMTTIKAENIQADAVADLKEEMENLRWYCHEKERGLETLETLKDELISKDVRNTEELSCLKEELLASNVKVQTLEKDNQRLKKELLQRSHLMK